MWICREISVGVRNQFSILRPLSSIGENDISVKPIVLTALKLFEWQSLYFAIRVEPWNVVFIAFHPVFQGEVLLFFRDAESSSPTMCSILYKYFESSETNFLSSNLSNSPALCL